MTIDVDTLREFQARAERIMLIDDIDEYTIQLKKDYAYIEQVGRNVSDREVYRSMYDNTLKELDNA